MRVLLLSLLVASLGCSSSEASTSGAAPDPVAFDPVETDLSLVVLANDAAERIIQGSVAKGATSATTCTTEVVAGCRITTCTKGATADPGTVVDPGKLTASSPSIGEDVEIPVADGYARLVQSGPFADGEEVHLVGAGSSEVAAFDLTVRVPATFAPKSIGDCPAGEKSSTPCTLAGAPIVVWTGGSGTIAVSLQEGADVSPRTALTCYYAAAPGKGRIPAEAIAKLPRNWPYSVALMAEEASAVATGGSGLHVGVRSLRWMFTPTLPPVKLP